jgi:D-amino-acid dehydrogenase
LIAPGHAHAWASPRAPGMLLRSLWRHDTALKLKLRADPALFAWGLDFLRNCSAERNRRNTLIKLRLCLLSHRSLNEIATADDIAYHRVPKGLLYFYRDRAHLDAGRANMAMLVQNGASLRSIGTEECLAIEPALAPARDRIAGAIYAPDEESGDCRLFTANLADKLRRARRDIRTSVPASRACAARAGELRRSRPIAAMSRPISMLALGSYAAPMARPVGETAGYPVKGYSLTVPIRDPDKAPTVGGVDEDRLVAFARMGDRLRMTSTAEIAGYSLDHRPSDFATMIETANELFPGAADFERPDYWTCLRPMTPDGPPFSDPRR